MKLSCLGSDNFINITFLLQARLTAPNYFINVIQLVENYEMKENVRLQGHVIQYIIRQFTVKMVTSNSTKYCFNEVS